jgi:hypothetical protein
MPNAEWSEFREVHGGKRRTASTCLGGRRTGLA